MANSSTLVLLLTCIFLQGTTAEVVIENNGYSGIVVTIHEDIPENPLLLESIKNMITKASPRLYKSTKQKAYFKQATIVVPSSWSSSPTYKSVPKDDYMSMAEVRIAPPHPSYGNIPYTMQLGDCGERGQYIHMTPEFILDKNPKTNNLRNSRNSKIFLHEWAHLRYGVFNEYGERGNAKSPIFYKDKNDKIRVNGCSATIKGWIRRSDGKSPCIIDINQNLVSDCTFYPDLDTGMKNGSGRASPMYMPELESADEFCDDQTPGNKHNPSAPNMHNRMCNTRSVLDVVNTNEDFRNNRNSPRQVDNLTPDILMVQLRSKSSPKFVLILDVSTSMTADNRLTFLQQATSRLLRYHIKDVCNVSLGMVSFSTGNTVLASLTTVNNSSREQLIQKIPKSAAGYTGIGGAILKAIEVLRQSGDAIEKSKLILLSDGEENVVPKIKDVTNQIKQAGVVIYTLAIGNQASLHLEELSRSTGGKADFFNPKIQGKSMDSILNTIILESGCNDLLPIINSNRAKVIQKGKNIQGTFDVDDGIGSTIIFISYNSPVANKGKYPLATITDPSGKIFNKQSPECITDENLGSIQFRIPKAQPGKWNYMVENPGSEDVHVNIMITSDTKTDLKNQTKGQPIRVRSWVSSVNVTYPETSKIFAEVTKDGMPVLRAKVEATGYRPDGKEEKIILKDNGKGADRIANDGVYTEYFTRYNGDGRYQIDVNVANTPETRLLNNGRPGPQSQRAPVMPILPEETQKEESRTEFFLSDLPQVNQQFNSSAIYTADTNVDPDFDSMDPVDDFERFDPAGTFLLQKWSPKDMIPPSKITDLSIVRTYFTERTVHLEWTSTGDDMYDGQATSIDLRYHHDSVHLIRSFEQSFSDFLIVNGSLDPFLAYEKHSIVIQLPPEESFSILNSSRNIYFAVRAMDEEGNVGQVSNAAIADFPLQEKLQPTNDAFPMYIIIAIAAGCAVAIIIVIVILFKVCSKNKKDHVDIDSEQRMGVEYSSKRQERTAIVGRSDTKYGIENLAQK